MISISAHVQSWLENNPFINSHLSDGIINHSALARKIKQEIEQERGEQVSIESITIALNRAGKNISGQNLISPLEYIGDISVQTNLDILIYEINDFNNLHQAAFDASKHSCFVSTRGIWHAAIITTSEFANRKILKSTASIHERNHTAITVRLRPGNSVVPGIIAGILSILANRGVNLREVISTHNELTMITNPDNADKTITALMDLKHHQ